jgi:hypothetical protein
MQGIRGDEIMRLNQLRSRGFTLIATLLLLLLLSGVALGLMFMVNTESRVGGSDLENSLAYHAAEGGMEKMTADLANLFASNQSPTPAAVAALQNYPPTIPGVVYPSGGYTITVPLNPDGTFQSRVSNISSGPNAGLIAQIIPMTLSVAAQRPLGDQVRMVRTVEVALIPVFQFGVFSESDLSYFPGPAFDFAGRVHTNATIFLADGNSLQLHSKVSAVKEVIRAKLANGWDTGSNYTGPVYIPNAPSGCDINNPPGPNCRSLALNEGSKVGDPNSPNNPNWPSISMGTYNSYIINGRTGATPLNLPFVGGGVGPVQIIRRPAPNELPGSPVATSRLYSQASIRILLSDDPAENHADGSPVDGQDIELASLEPANLIAKRPADSVNASDAQAGIAVAGVAGTSYFGEAITVKDPHFVTPATIYGQPFPGGNEWPLIDGWLRVEIKKADGTWLPVTAEWLQLGFARGLQPPNSDNGVPNAAHPRAILIFQQLADRDLDGKFTSPNESSNVSGPNSQYNWFPINFYDPREGEVRDNSGNGNIAPVIGGPAPSCSANGVMNAVELDVNNLKQWLTGAFGGNGLLVDWSKENGYLLYFSDRRGMQPDKNVAPITKVGEYGFEDLVNSSDPTGTPDGRLEAAEDVDGNGQIDSWGGYNVGEAFGPIITNDTHALNPNPFKDRIGCLTTARKNRVSGTRHVIRVLNGTRGNLPTRPDGKGGFTVASENPVYVLGDYNAKTSEHGWNDPHAAAAVIADAVTLLSNNWSDTRSFQFPSNPNSRPASETYYRLAIAAGKNINFQRPLNWSPAQDFGTDGGLHNFLRYIENWGGTNLWYEGSLVSLYYSQYATGIFKCCSTVYNPPARKYSFDVLFLNPENLPPGTPMFRDVDNVSYRQDFTPY